MDLKGKTIWQIAAGDGDLNYTDFLLLWDVIVVGPGRQGSWPDCEPQLVKEKWTSKKISDLRRFCTEIKPDDIIILRLGTSHVYGVGEVVGNYQWSDLFGDFDGWDLQHFLRVRWLWTYNENEEPVKFPKYTLNWGNTTQIVDKNRVSSKHLINWLEKLVIPQENFERDLKILPKLPKVDSYIRQIGKEDIGNYLYDHGIASSLINNLLGQIDELTRIASWYYRQLHWPSEQETIAYSVIPLLRVLGWTPQKMAIEWKHIDIALFHRLPREDRNVRVIIEAKSKKHGVLSKMDQASTYLKDRDECDRIIVTNGVQYGIYIRKQGEFSRFPSAYLNLTRMLNDYPIMKCKGAKEAFLYMTSEWNNDISSSAGLRSRPT